MTPDKATALREAAERATPGPWTLETGDHSHFFSRVIDAAEMTVAYRYYTGSRKQAEKEYLTYAYIALADPPTIMALLAERERLRGALRACIDRIEKPNLSPDANYVVERARQALEATDDQT